MIYIGSFEDNSLSYLAEFSAVWEIFSILGKENFQIVRECSPAMHFPNHAPVGRAAPRYKSNHDQTGFDHRLPPEIVDRARGVEPFRLPSAKISARLPQKLSFWFYPMRYA